MAKNVVICCDGTGNQFGGCNSNVVKLYTALTINKEQVGYYHPGLGTMGAPNARGRLAKAWSVVNGLAFGGGFMDNVEDAYRYLMSTYDDGDRVYLFGFSRGAYTVRALAAILHAYGLLCKGNEGHIPYVLRMFTDDMREARRQKKPTLAVADAFKETFSHAITLRFVGLWDTVSSVGWVYEPVKLLYSAQNPSIEEGRHAVSLDERRCFYQDNLWGPALRPEEAPDLQKNGAEQDILQAWFAGVHSDVGGSYAQREGALANAALEWMLQEAIAAGVQLHPDRLEMVFGRKTAGEHAAAGLYPAPDQPGIVHTSLQGAWRLLELLPHRYYDKDDGKEQWRIPFGHPRMVPEGAIIHPSVFKRMEDARCNYHPENLQRGKLVPYAEAEATQPLHIKTKADLTRFYVYRGAAAPRRATKLESAVAAGVVSMVALATAFSIFRRLSR
jgi:uncharacterized protein (DUF2235 family)